MSHPQDSPRACDSHACYLGREPPSSKLAFLLSSPSSTATEKNPDGHSRAGGSLQGRAEGRYRVAWAPGGPRGLLTGGGLALSPGTEESDSLQHVRPGIVAAAEVRTDSIPWDGHPLPRPRRLGCHPGCATDSPRPSPPSSGWTQGWAISHTLVPQCPPIRGTEHLSPSLAIRPDRSEALGTTAASPAVHSEELPPELFLP